jgi:hypothetical protein
MIRNIRIMGVGEDGMNFTCPPSIPQPLCLPRDPTGRSMNRSQGLCGRMPKIPVVSAIDKKGYKSIQATIWRWREEYQNDFAARIGWSTKNYSEANHPPVPRLSSGDHLRVKSGDLFHLSALGTTDPDGDSMSYFWFQYPEAGTYRGLISFAPYATNLYDLPVTAPWVDSPQTIHFILKVTDKGKPPLTRYKRVIVTVLPR